MSNVPDDKITLGSKNNGSVTHETNEHRLLSRDQREFLKKATMINIEEGRPFSVMDFPNISKGNFRQKIFKLKHKIELVCRDHVAFYKVRGMSLAGDSRRITPPDMRVGINFAHVLEQLRDSVPMIHDIKLKFESTTLHAALLKLGHVLDPSNHSIKLVIPRYDHNITMKVLVYPKTVQIDVGCTYKPLVYDISGIFFLHEQLLIISHYLTAKTGLSVTPPHEWIVTHYHFGKDGNESLSGQSFHYTMDEVSAGLLRVYTKVMPEGNSILRIEQVRTPKQALAKELQSVLNSSKSFSVQEIWHE